MTIHIGLFADLPPQAQTILFIGGRSSDHLRELTRIAEFKGRLAYRIESVSELQPRWFVGVEEVGVVVGASDLERMVPEVVNRLKVFAAAQALDILEGVAQ